MTPRNFSAAILRKTGGSISRGKIKCSGNKYLKYITRLLFSFGVVKISLTSQGCDLQAGAGIKFHVTKTLSQ